MLGHFFKPKIGSDTAVGITEEGRKESDRYVSRGPLLSILSALRERTPQTIQQLSRETNMSVFETKKHLKVLVRLGFVRFTAEG